MRILVAVEAVDFRRGIDGLAQVCREVLAADPFSGTVFVFRGRSGTSIKLLTFDGQGPDPRLHGLAKADGEAP